MMQLRIGIVFLALTSTTLFSSCSRNGDKTTSAKGEEGLQAVTSDRVHLSNLATLMINDAREAHDRLANSQTDAAADRINDALRQWNEIESKAKGQRYVPIYQEVETVSVWQPHAVIENGKVTPVAPPAEQAAKAAAQAKPAVAGMAGAITTISADVQAIGEHLKAAQHALQDKDTKAAEAALAVVPDAVVEQSVAGDLPLIRARQNLILARSRAQTNDWAGTRAALDQASSAFQEYANFPNNTHRSDAEKVKQQVDQFASNVEQKHSNAAKKIQSWWDETSDWIISPNQPSNQTAHR